MCGSADEYVCEAKVCDAVLLFKGSRKSGLEKIVQRLTDAKHITQLVINFSALRNNPELFPITHSANNKNSGDGESTKL
ncbi:MAG: hypothetical protein IPM74_15675 [Crocinitomicaceae bacterium]|nr:hypothetical protein [Crocinitomicaceae bacterium]